MVKNLLKKEEEEALKMLGGDKAVKEEEKKEEKSEKEEPKKVKEMEEEILSEFVPGVVTKPVSPLLALEKKESRRLEEHAAEARLPKKEEKDEDVKYTAPMYGERGHEERLSAARETNEGVRRANVEGVQIGRKPIIELFNPRESISPGAGAARKYELTTGTSEFSNANPFMRKSDAKKYVKR